MRKLSGRLYRLIYRIRETLEHYHLATVVVEVTLLLFGAFRVFAGLHGMSPLEVGDIALLFVLCMFLIADLLVRLRGSRRGYDFGHWLAAFKFGRAPLRNEEQLIARLRELCMHGLSGGPIEEGADSSIGHAVTEAIAKESASVYSVKTLGTADVEWAHAEAEYLHGWFAKFSAAIWWVPPLARAGAHETPARRRAPYGYFSVIVPITEESYQMIRKGHLNTAFALIDAEAAAFASQRRVERYPKRLRFLAYAQVSVAEPRSPRQTDLSPLFFCSLEHVAFLLRRFYPLDDAWRSHSHFSIICEASNSAQLHALQLLGFAPVKTANQTNAPVRKSPVGFALCELNGERRSDHDDISAGGDALLRFIRLGLEPVSATRKTPQAVS